MSKDPAFLLYSQDFLVGVSDLTFEERGQYITLLCLQHQKGHLSEKAIQLVTANVSQDVLAKFEIDEDGNYYNSTLEKIITKRDNYSASRSENGKNGGRPRKTEENHTKTIEKPYGFQNQKHTKSIVVSTEKPQKKHTENENENINIIENIIVYLNNKLNTRYKSTTKDIQSIIIARIKEGFIYDDFISVIDIKYEEWKGTEFEKYLRPKTLFNAQNFQSYLNQKSRERYGDFSPKSAFEKALEKTYSGGTK